MSVTTVRVDTRRRVLGAARHRFALHSYAEVTLRDIAADVGVSPALVVKYFGSKEGLLCAAADYGAELDALIDRPIGDLGRHMVEQVLGRGSASEPFLALLFMAGRDDAPPAVRRGLRAQFVDRLAACLAGPEAALRAELVCAELVGLAAMRRVLKAPALRAADRQRVADLVEPSLQALLTGRASPGRR